MITGRVFWCERWPESSLFGDGWSVFLLKRQMIRDHSDAERQVTWVLRRQVLSVVRWVAKLAAPSVGRLVDPLVDKWAALPKREASRSFAAKTS